MSKGLGIYTTNCYSTGDRLFVLDEPSLEEYIPPELYNKAGRTKEADLERLKRLSNDFKGLKALKREICTQIAQNLMLEDFDQLPEIRDAVQRAANWGPPAGGGETATRAEV